MVICGTIDPARLSGLNLHIEARFYFSDFFPLPIFSEFLGMLLYSPPYITIIL